MSVQLVIVSEVRVYREGLAMALASRPGVIEVTGVCATPDEVLDRIGPYSEAVVLLDLSGGPRLSEIRQLRASLPEVTTLALALFPDSELEIIAAAEAGIAGYISPDASIEDLVRTVEQASRGEMACTPRVAGTLARRLASLATGRSAPAAAGVLTARETEVLQLLDEGLSNKQIARQLSIRLATVKNHVHSILAKLNVKRRGEAVAATRVADRHRPHGVTDAAPRGDHLFG